MTRVRAVAPPVVLEPGGGEPAVVAGLVGLELERSGADGLGQERRVAGGLAASAAWIHVGEPM